MAMRFSVHRLQERWNDGTQKKRVLLAGFVAHMGEERLPRRVMFGEIDVRG